MADLYNSRDQLLRQGQDKSLPNLRSLHAIAWAQLLSFIDEVRSDCSVAPIFKLSDLVAMYSERLSQLSGDETTANAACDVNRTRIKERLMDHYPNMRAQLEGRNVLLVFDSDIGPALKEACQQYSDRCIVSCKSCCDC